MYIKKIENFYMHIDRIAMDVSKQNGTYRIITADYESSARMVFSLDGKLLSSNIDDSRLIKFTSDTVKRNLKILRRLAKERSDKAHA